MSTNDAYSESLRKQKEMKSAMCRLQKVINSINNEIKTYQEALDKNTELVKQKKESLTLIREAYKSEKEFSKQLLHNEKFHCMNQASEEA